jgi:hypothetical protein
MPAATASMMPVGIRKPANGAIRIVMPATQSPSATRRVAVIRSPRIGRAKSAAQIGMV